MKELFRFWICLICLGLTLYGFVKEQNELTKIQMAIPHIKKELATVQQKNVQLHYELQKWEEPSYLQALLRRAEFEHLVFPGEDDEG